MTGEYINDHGAKFTADGTPMTFSAVLGSYIERAAQLAREEGAETIHVPHMLRALAEASFNVNHRGFVKRPAAGPV